MAMTRASWKPDATAMLSASVRASGPGHEQQGETAYHGAENGEGADADADQHAGAERPPGRLIWRCIDGDADALEAGEQSGHRRGRHGKG